MGNDTSRTSPTIDGVSLKSFNATNSGTSIDQDIYQLSLSSHEDLSSLMFDPSQSAALCVGVGSQQDGKDGIGESAEHDAHNVAHFITNKLFISPDRCKVLATETTNKPTSKNILHNLKHACKLAGPEGLLILQFSGHCVKMKTPEGEIQGALVPTDFSRSDPSVLISMKKLGRCITRYCNNADTKILIVLDCCYAGQVAGDLANDWSGMSSLNILAACNSAEQSLCHNALRNGFFTFFLLIAWRKSDLFHPSSCVLPLDCLSDVDNWCQALLSILQPAYQKHFAIAMSPMLVRTGLKSRETTDAGRADDVKVSEKFKCLWPFLNFGVRAAGRPYEYPPRPPIVGRYLKCVVEPAMEILVDACKHDWQDIERRFNRFVMSVGMESLVSLTLKEMPDDFKKTNLLRTEWFFMLYMNLANVLKDAQPKLVITSLEEISNAAGILPVYAAKMAKELDIKNHLRDKSMEELVLLYEWLNIHLKK